MNKTSYKYRIQDAIDKKQQQEGSAIEYFKRNKSWKKAEPSRSDRLRSSAQSKEEINVV